jgi:hypothetical protein
MLDLDLVTPRANVLRVWHDHTVATAHGERIGAVVGLVAGACAAVVGGYLLGLAAKDSDGPEAPAISGATLLTIGTFFTVEGIAGLLATDRTNTIYSK